MTTLFSNINYLADNFSENVDGSKSKFKQVVFELLHFVLKAYNNRFLKLGLDF